MSHYARIFIAWLLGNLEEVRWSVKGWVEGNIMLLEVTYEAEERSSCTAASFHQLTEIKSVK